MTECFALLDDDTASDTEPRSRRYTGFVRILRCSQFGEWSDMLDQMQLALMQGLYAVGLFSYELGAAMMGVDYVDSDAPLAQVLLFERCEPMSSEAVTRWLESCVDDAAHAGIANGNANITEAEFADAIATIRSDIEAGDTYQVNYTYRLRFDVYGAPLALYRRLRARQPVPYGAFIALPDGAAVLSLSPELFLRHENGTLTARPMKGTAPASGDAREDDDRAQALASDEKNRAENLMIVDLLRNDLGRIAKFGSVRVPELHRVSRYGSVLQMTSTITAHLREDVSLAEVFRAVYPCGSITGAPKMRTMQIIREVEPEARGLYTGAIGWFDAPGCAENLGNFCLSVPIRTLMLSGPDGGVRQGVLGVGAGIVYDSVAEEEYAECQLKARFLSGLPQMFELFETMRASRDGCPLLARHLLRLQSSANYFGLPFDEAVIRTQIREACEELGEGDHRLRLTLGENGASVHAAALLPLVEPVRVLLADAPMRSDDLFLRHKTTVRQIYDAAWREAEQQGAFDTLFFNERGELTEGGRCSVFLRLDGRWFTPPLAAGVLPGVMRAVLLDDPAWGASERRLRRGDLLRAEEIVVCNALRGVVLAVIN